MEGNITSPLPLPYQGRDKGRGHKRAVIIVNPVAHNLPSRPALDEVDVWLRERGWQVQWEQTAEPGHATYLAAAAADTRAALVFVCGGDGTMREAASGLRASETALAMIPAGTVNIWARETKTPRRPLAAVQAIINGEQRLVDLGRAGEHYFLLMAGYGLDGAITHRVSLRAKRYAGAAAYALAALRESLFYKGKAVSLDIDGERIRTRALMMLIGNTRNYAGLTKVTPNAFVDDGLLDVCVFCGSGPLDSVAHAGRVLLRRHLNSRQVIYRKARRIDIEWEEPFALHLDGDACAESATTVDIVPRALRMQVPSGRRIPIFLP